MKSFFRSKKNKIQPTPSGMELLEQESPFVMNNDQRAAMTISCRDTDYIPKVKNAGDYKEIEGQKVQIMHNGLFVKRGGYHGEWMEQIIEKLHGHHEPQEEKVFFEILKRLGKGASMIELGCFWAYYSLWFNKTIPDAINIGCEPDPNNIKVGMANAQLNKANITFIPAAVGKERGEVVDFRLDSDQSKTIQVPVMPVDEILETKKLKKLDLLHMDVQGFELDGMESAKRAIKEGKLRFLMVSTHHYSISGDPLTHFKCMEKIEALGGHIIANHTVLESFSGDGLIAASFDVRDKDFHIPISVNSSTHSLFRPYEYDLAKIIEEYEALRSKS
jgi:FkbM family methyltransferase